MWLKVNYFVESEIKDLGKEELLRQAVLGIQSCKTKGDVVEILDDVWAVAQGRERSKWTGKD